MCLGLSIFIAGINLVFEDGPASPRAETSPSDGTIQVSAEPANYPTVVLYSVYEMDMAIPIILEGVVLVSSSTR